MLRLAVSLAELQVRRANKRYSLLHVRWQRAGALGEPSWWPQGLARALPSPGWLQTRPGDDWALPRDVIEPGPHHCDRDTTWGQAGKGHKQLDHLL
jgi:hypothetical protein